MSEIRVLQVLAGYARRGAEIHALSLAQGVRDTRIRMGLALFFDAEVAREAERLGLDARVVGKRFRGDPSLVFRLARLIRRERIQVVHTHLINGNFYGRIAARLAGGCAVVSTVHNYKEALMTPREWVKTLFYRQDVLMGRLSDRVISVTEGLRAQLIRDGMPPDRVLVIPNSIDTGRYDPDRCDRAAVREALGLPEGAFVVGTAGRLAREKRLDLFLQVGRGLLRAGVPAKLLLVGEGYLEAELRDLAREMDMEEAVVFAGYRSDLPRVVHAMDAFALCSETETTSVVIVEAMAMRRPVVAMAAGDLAETFTDGVTGHLVAAGDVGAMTEALVGLYRDPAGRRAMGRAGRQEALRKFSREETVKQVVRVYEDVVRARSSNGRGR